MIKKLFTVILCILLICMQMITVFAESDITVDENITDQAITEVEKNAQSSKNDTKTEEKLVKEENTSENTNSENSNTEKPKEESKEEKVVEEPTKQETKQEDSTKDTSKEETIEEKEIKYVNQHISVDLYEDKNLNTKVNTSTKISIEGNLPEDLEVFAYLNDKDNEDKYLDYKFVYKTSIEDFVIKDDVLVTVSTLNNFNVDYKLYKVYNNEETELQYKHIDNSNFDVEVSKFDELYVLIPEETKEEIKDEEKVEEETTDDNDINTNEEVTNDSSNTIDNEKLSSENTDTNKVIEELNKKLNALNDTREVADTYNVIVNFVFSDNTIAFEPVVITVNAGDMCVQTIPVESIVGYEPHYGDDVVDHIDIDIPEVNNNVNMFVIYRPVQVEYTVEHYLQNADDDNYTLADTDTGYEYTGTQLNNLERAYEGFVSQPYEKPVVAADGSTVVEIYYDREYSLITFNLQGGYGVDPIYQKWGSTITVGTPQRRGYLFTGWDKTIPTTMPYGGDSFTASWEPIGTEYTIIYWKQNANNDEYSYWGTEVTTTPTGTTISSTDRIPTTIAGNEKEHFVFNSELSDKDVPVNGDGTTLINAYYDRKVYTITLINENGNDYICGLEEHTHSYNSRETIYYGGCYPNTGSTTRTCGYTTEHTHTYNCWSNTRNSRANNTATRNLNSNYQQVNGSIGVYRNQKYIYVNGSWYQYNGNNAAGTIMEPDRNICPKYEHTHTYADSEVIYYGGCYPEEGGTSRICGLEEHTHTTSCRGTLIHRISARYGANILDEWTFTGEDGVDYPTTSPVSTWYPVQSSIYTERLANIQIMPGEYSIFRLYTSTNSMKTYEYYVEALPGQTADRIYNGTNYVLHYSMVHDFNKYTQAEDFLEFDGFTKQYARTSNGSALNNGASLSANATYYFYYSRNKYKIEYQSKGEILTHDANENSLTTNTYTQIPYQLSLENYNIEPPYPSNIPVGAYSFGGWYDNSDFAGSPFDFSTSKMPSSDMVLFAKWVPAEYTVKVFKDLTQAESDTSPLYTYSKSYGSTVDPIDTPTPDSEEYIFMGWFYDDNGVEKPFVFGNTLITHDISVYAKWTSHSIRPYNIYFKDTHGNEIAEAIHGSGYAGTTKTFTAKEDVPEGFFPMVKNHSIIIDIDGTDENGINDFTFIYDNVAPVPYTVHYVDSATGQSLAPDKYLPDNRAVKVTEKFKYIEGYVPDAYQKILIVSITGNNEITFYYTRDDNHAYYITNHYYQIDNGWTLYNSLETFSTIGTNVNAVPMNIPGYELDLSVPGTVSSGRVIPQGLEMNLYYVGRLYPYVIRYVDRNTGIAVHEPTEGEARYNTTLTAQALEISGYDAIETEKNIVIQQENGTTVRHNIITFYYQREQAKFDYIPSTGGRVSNSTENVAAVAGVAIGSNAIPSDGYEFDGWYLDENHTQPVTAGYATINDTHILPIKINGRYVSRTFYAKFKPTTLTINIEKVDFDLNLVHLVAKYNIYKIDSSGSIVKSFKGTNVNCSLVDTITTSDNLSIALQRGESYLFEETEAPEGYSMWHGLAKVTITSDGLVFIASELRDGMITYDNLLHKLTLKDDATPVIPSGFNDSVQPYLFMLLGILLLLGVISISYRLFNNKVVKKKN